MRQPPGRHRGPATRTCPRKGVQVPSALGVPSAWCAVGATSPLQGEVFVGDPARSPDPNMSPAAQQNLPVPEAAKLMVIHHAHGLHERIADGGTHELEAALLEVLAHCVRKA